MHALIDAGIFDVSECKCDDAVGHECVGPGGELYGIPVKERTVRLSTTCKLEGLSFRFGLKETTAHRSALLAQLRSRFGEGQDDVWSDAPNALRVRPLCANVA